jgi:hypothetical protein
MSDISARSDQLVTGPAKGWDRRQVLKAGAWAAPVVLLTASLPAAAASTTLTAHIDTFKAKRPLNNSVAEFEYKFRIQSSVQNDNTGGDVLTITLSGLNQGAYTGTVSGGGITWGPVVNGAVTGTRAAASRGQSAQGAITLGITSNNPGTLGGVTVTMKSTNANGQSSNVAAYTVPGGGPG